MFDYGCGVDGSRRVAAAQIRQVTPLVAGIAFYALLSLIPVVVMAPGRAASRAQYGGTTFETDVDVAEIREATADSLG